MNLVNFRKLRLLNLIVCLAFCLNLGLSGNALALGKIEKASATSMLRPTTASQRLGNIVLDMEIGKLRGLAAQGAKALEKELADLTLTKDTSLTELIENNIAVVTKGNKNFVVCSIDNGWSVDLDKGDIVPFASVDDRNAFLSDVQLTWIAGNYTPEEIRDIQDEVREYLIQAGKEGRIFRGRNIKEQVDAYLTKRAKGLPALTDKEKAALVAGLEAEFASDGKIIGKITQGDVNDMFMPQLLFGGNWKERKDIVTEENARAKAREFKQKFAGLRLQGAVVVIFPEAKWVKAVAEELAGTNIIVGVQSKFFGDAKNPGDFTPERLQAKIDEAVAMGAQYANVGHSMHRLAGEGLSDEQANKMMKAILQDGRLIPWYTIEVSGKKDPNAEITEGINIGLDGITKEQLAAFPITPEPTALISTKEGTGAVDKSIQISAADTAQLSRLILKALKKEYGRNIKVNAGYGASVKGDNAAAIFDNEEITNALIGGASLEAQAFFDTVQNGIKGKLTELASTIPTAEEIKQDMKRVGLAFVLDEDGNPSFFNKGEIGTAKHVAVTLSSGGFKYAGYKDAAMGMPARSIYDPFAMRKIYTEMAKTDPDAARAYRLKRLHDHFEVSAKGAKLHRQETKEVVDLINKYDAKAFKIWKEREAEKARVRQLEVESKKTITEATSANIRKFLKGGVVSSELIAGAEAELQKLVESKLLTGYRLVIKDSKVSILTTRKNSQAEEDSAKVPAAILNVYLSVLNTAKEKGIYIAEDLTGKTYRQQTDALEISAPLPTLTYLEPEGWAKSFFGKKIRTELTVPEGQAKGFFTRVYNGYVIGGLFAKPIEQIPDAVVDAVRKKLNQDIAQGKILSAEVRDFGATDIKVIVTHRYGQLNSAVQRLVLEAMKEGVLEAKELGLLREDIDVASINLEDLGKELRVTANEDSITERGAEPVVIMQMVGAGMGAVNINEYSQFFIPGSTPLQKLGYLPKGKAGPRGWRMIVRRTDDVLKGNYDGPVWEFETSQEFEDAKGNKYPSVNQSIVALALSGAPNDYVCTEIWPVEGSALPSTEPVITIVYQPVYGEKGELRTLNPTVIARSQSGADAVGGIAGIWYAPHFVPGGENAEHAVVTKPVTLEEARKAPPEGIAYVAFWGWQSEGGGIIPTEEGTRIDHVAVNFPAVGPERRIADWLASIMNTWPDDQPSLTPAAAEARVAPIREAQRDFFETSPKETEADPVMAEVEAKVASGEYLSFVDDKADMGGLLGHNFTPSYMLAIDVATAIEAMEKGILTDGNIIGFVEKLRLKRGLIYDIGDDEHILLLGDKSPNAAQSHQLSFLAFTRGYLASVVGNDKKAPRPKGLYGRGQDFAGKEAKAAMANPYFYSQFSERFFEILREVMPEDHMNMVDLMYEGWKKWQQTSKETTVLLDSFSGNVSHQGIGTARYLVDIKGGERRVGILAGDKMGPAADNIVIRESVYASLKAVQDKTIAIPNWITAAAERNFYLKFIEQLKNGLVFEIQDAKAFDEHGNIRIDRLPELFSEIAEYVNPDSLKDASERDFVTNSYAEGKLKGDLTQADKVKLAQLIKKAGFVPTERIYLDAQEDKEAIYRYLADSDRFNVKQVWSKKKAGWDISKRQDYLDKPILGSAVTKLGIIAGGSYIGKDDPVMIGNILLMEYVFEFFKTHPYLIIQGDMNGSHWLAAVPTASQNAVATKDSQPILVAFRYTLSEDGTKLAKVEDVFDNKDYDLIRKELFEFNREFKIAALGGQFWPYGTDVRTVEGAYPLAQLLRELNDPNSPFLVKNMPAAKRKSRPIAPSGELVDLFKTVTGTLEMPAAPAGWTGADESAQRFQDSLLSQQSPIGGKLNDTVIEAAKGEKKFIVIKADSALESDTSLISALESINRQINQSLGVFGSDANIAANAYQFLLVFDDPGLNKAENVEKLFAEIADFTKNGTTANKDLAAKILTQEDMYEGAISNAADLLKQLKRMGISEDLVAGLVGPKEWTTNLKAQKGIAENVVIGNSDAEKNKIAFAGNALFAVVEAVATTNRQITDSMAKKLELTQVASTISVVSKEIAPSISDEIEAYRNQVEEARRA